MMDNKRPSKFVGYSAFVSFSALLLLSTLSITTLLLPVRSAFAGSYSDGYNKGCYDAARDPKGLNSHGYDESVHHGNSEFLAGYVNGYSVCWNEGNYQASQKTYSGPGNSGRSSTSSSDNSWQLAVELTKPPFGVENVRVAVYGPFGYKDYQIINWQEAVDVQGAESRSINVYFDIPNRVIPVGYHYRVCAGTGLIGTILPNCHTFAHSFNGDDSVRLSLS